MIGSDRAKGGHRIAGRQAVGEQRQTLEANAQVCAIESKKHTRGMNRKQSETRNVETRGRTNRSTLDRSMNIKCTPLSMLWNNHPMKIQTQKTSIHIPSKLSQIVRCALTCFAFSISTAFASLRNSCADCSSISSSLRQRRQMSQMQSKQGGGTRYGVQLDKDSEIYRRIFSIQTLPALLVMKTNDFVTTNGYWLELLTDKSDRARYLSCRCSFSCVSSTLC